MKKSLKICLGLATLAAAGIAILKIFRDAKKEYKELELREKVNQTLPRTENPGESKVDTEDEEEDQVDYETNLPKRLFREVRYNLSNIDLPVDCVDLDYVFEGKYPSEHVVHVKQCFDERSNRNVLDFLFEIPISALPNVKDKTVKVERKYTDGSTCVGDFVRAIKGVYDRDLNEVTDRGFAGEMEDIVTNAENLGIQIKNSKAFRDCRLEGYIFLSYQEKDEEDDEWFDVVRLLPVNKSICENNPYNETHTSATDYIFDLKSHLREGEDGPVLESSDPEKFRNLKVLDGFAAVRVSFNMQDKRNIDGINHASGAKIMKMISENLRIYRGDQYDEDQKGGVFEYTSFMFYDPDSISTVSVFDVNDNGNLVVSELF